MASSALICDTEQWKGLQIGRAHYDFVFWCGEQAHVGEIQKTHLRHLMHDVERCKAMTACLLIDSEYEGIYLDYSRQRATGETMEKLFKLAEAAKLKEKIEKMFRGDKINSTENRSVLHVALRAPRDEVIKSDGVNVVPEVWGVKDKIKQFSETFRSGSWVGATGKALTNVVSVGIGGSFLGPLFVHAALQTDPEAAESAKGRQLRFLANVDPVDVARSIKDLEPETTLGNHHVLRFHTNTQYRPDAVAKHMIAVSTNLELVEKFGIDPKNAFAFWDWVGGRYSVCSAVGVLPLSLQYGFPIVQKFLEGAASIDKHFRSSSFEKNIPLSMESNGKGVSIDGVQLPFESGEIDFGEPGTNGQHSFYQLIHQGRVIPCDFISVVKSQQPVYLKGEIVSNHDELMSNFFAQPDALAYGKFTGYFQTPEQLHSEEVPEHLIPHKTFQGNRPSLSLLLPSLSAYEIGQLLAIYEHRIAVQGFLWGINSFDQWGVELGKSLASQVRKSLHASRVEGKPVLGFNSSTTSLLTRYLAVEPSTPYNATTLPKV
uniref:Glucose-6-phosphate isomerase n=1 Tax=Oryza meridionalis TaxID=40149 RepID=A0A0E0D7K9_9ORYZ